MFIEILKELGMIEFDIDKKQLRISIPVSSLEVIDKYRQSLIKLLDRIEIDDCNPGQMENLNTIYELLSHLQLDEKFLSQHKELLSGEGEEECKQAMLQS